MPCHDWYLVLCAVAGVHDGYVLTKSVARSPLAGNILTKCMLQALQSKDVEVRPRYAFKRIERAPGQFEVGTTVHSC